MAELEVTWLGHSTFLFKTHSGKAVLIDPWVMGNPACPKEAQRFKKLDILLVTHGHFDHIGDSIELAKNYKPEKIIGVFETCHWLESKGVLNTSGMNKGGTQKIGGIEVTMVHADHSCGILDEGRILYGGEAAGYVLTFENGYRVYHAGDTNVFSDMRLIAELYRPDAAFIPIGDFYTMGPREANLAARLLGCPKVVPMHHGTFPLLAGRPERLKGLLQDLSWIEVLTPEPGKPFVLSR
jgi:L-ascorbate metabolism protein UlaG (beta-lactamase superfamily)